MHSCLSRSKSSLWASGHSEDFPAGGFVSPLGSSFLLSADTKLLPLGETELFNHTIISCIAFTSHLQWPCASITSGPRSNALGLSDLLCSYFCLGKKKLHSNHRFSEETQEERKREWGKERSGREEWREGKRKEIRRQCFRLLVLQQSACRLAVNQQLSSE